MRGADRCVNARTESFLSTVRTINRPREEWRDASFQWECILRTCDRLNVFEKQQLCAGLQAPRRTRALMRAGALHSFVLNSVDVLYRVIIFKLYVIFKNSLLQIAQF